MSSHRFLEFHYHPEESLSNHALSDHDYKYSVASGYVIFEIVAPKELQYTYKISPAPFALPFNSTFRDPIPLVLSDPSCGCGYLKNSDDVEVNLDISQFYSLNEITNFKLLGDYQPF